jgi:hypothetical protein
MDDLQKDEYGLYINAKNYEECRALVIISKLLELNLKSNDTFI